MDDLIDPFRRLVDHACPPATARAIEGGADWRPPWRAFAESGFLDALVAEDAGGAGLTLADAAPLIALVGAHAVPLPVGETMIARALLSRAGMAAPDGPIVLATGALPTPLALVATHALTGAAEALRLVALDDLAATGICHDLDAIVRAATAGLRPIAAVVRALLIAGAAGAVLDMTVAYANERSQFGKPIGRQQAVQQQLAVLAEQAVAARIAAAAGARGGLSPDPFIAGVAKHGASVAAADVVAIAHAVHGAIGISEEHELQRLTRRLNAWRLADGSATFWAGRIGGMMAGCGASTLDHLRFGAIGNGTSAAGKGAGNAHSF